MSTMLTQAGGKVESVYGTSVVVDHFWEFNSESIKLNMGRARSTGLRSGTRTPRSDRVQPFRIGASGAFVFDVPTKGFPFWLVHMLGTVATGSVVDSNYTHTGTEGSLLGDFFTFQLNRPFNPSGTAQAFTYEGGKVSSWELSCDLDGNLVCTLNLDFEDESTVTALASAVYPTGFNIFTWAQGAITIAAVAAEISNFKVGCDNGLNTNRRYLRGNTLKKEPVESSMRNYTWSAQMDFSSLTEYNRFRDALATNSIAQIIATFQGPVAHAGATLPSVVITIPAAEFDAADVNIGGPQELTIGISGVALSNGTNSPVTIAATTTDVVP